MQWGQRFLVCICLILSTCLMLCCCSKASPAGSTASNTSNASNISNVSSGSDSLTSSDEKGTRDSTPKVLLPEASGETVYSNQYAAIDASHTDQGYVMIHYTGTCANVKVQIFEDENDPYTYQLNLEDSWNTFPLSIGSGAYTVRVLENVGGESYAVALTQEIDVSLSDEFLPFLYPNQYVDFTADSTAVTKAEALAESAGTDLDVVGSVYHYIIENITYDKAKAETVTYGYTPDVDETLETGTGICFDYASLMTAMLRSQRIPTRLEVGYSGSAYHAWISTYIEDIGWIDNIIEFDGETWRLLDPTLGASNSEDSVAAYIGDGSNYQVKYYY